MIAAFLALSRPVRIALAILAGVIALGLIAILWLRAHDRAVIDNHEAKITTQIGQATTAANEAANANDAKRAATNAVDAARNEEAIRHAEEQHPDEVRRPSGPAVNAITDRLRERARQTGSPAR